jgi:RNA polymerase sigma-70 factor (ECF subfamily)
MKTSEHDWVKEYRTNRSREALLGLLESCQHPVYNVCFQVLRHRQDAEDAAQEALLKTLDGLRSMSDIERFEPWLYRVALNTAINHRKRAACRAVHESRRLSMDEAPSRSEVLHAALYEALVHLDDDSRRLVLQHFFERRSLEEIGRERGCSSVAVWKRIDKAKELLRRALAGSGYASAIQNLDLLFHSIEPVSAPASLLSEEMIQQASLLLGHAKIGAAATMGGMAMSAKGLSAGALIIVSAILFVAGTGGGLLIKASIEKESPAPSVEGRDRVRGSEKSSNPSAAPASASAASSAVAVLAANPKPASSSAERREELKGRLRQLSDLTRQRWEAVNRGALYAQRMEIEERCTREWHASRDLAYADAATTFEFLRATESEELFQSFLFYLADTSTGKSEFGPIPRQIVDGLVDLLVTGTTSQKHTLISLVAVGSFDRGGAGDVFLQACYDRLLVEKDPQTLSSLLNSFTVFRSSGLNAVEKLEGRLEVVRDLWQDNPQWGVRAQCLEVLGRMRSPAARELFFEKLGEAIQSGDRFLQGQLPPFLDGGIAVSKPGEEDRYLPYLMSAFTSVSDPYLYRKFLETALTLPLPKATLLLEDAQNRCPNEETKAGIGRALELIRSGETRVNVLQSSLRKTK